MTPGQVRRYARHIALPEVGADGQEHIGRALAVVIAGTSAEDVVAETAARYLAAGGIGRLRLVCPPSAIWDEHEAALQAATPDAEVARIDSPRAADGWLEALGGASVAVRAGFHDDPSLRAAIRLGVPLVAARGRSQALEVIAFRRHGPCPHQNLEVAPQRATPSEAGPAAIAAGALAAAEALLLLAGGSGSVGPPGGARARYLTLPLDGGEPRTADIPWTPECFACGGSGMEMTF